MVSYQKTWNYQPEICFTNGFPSYIHSPLYSLNNLSPSSQSLQFPPTSKLLARILWLFPIKLLFLNYSEIISRNRQKEKWASAKYNIKYNSLIKITITDNFVSKMKYDMKQHDKQNTTTRKFKQTTATENFCKSKLHLGGCAYTDCRNSFRD